MSSLIRPRDIGGSLLVRDYLSAVPQALHFYGSSPFSLSTYERKLAEVSDRFDRAKRQEVAAAVRPSTENARRRLTRFVEEGGAVITTGQQAGFLTGPLYTIHKALSAVALANYLEGKLGVVVLPVFWIASEDHDWDEVNHTFMIDRVGKLRKFELPSEDRRPLPMSERSLEGDLDSLTDEIRHFVGSKGDASDYVTRILDAYRVPGRRVADGFRAALEVIFRDVDILITDAADPVVKQTSSVVLRASLLDAQRHEEVLSARTKSIAEAGYSSQVAVLEGGVNLFLRTSGGRERLYRRGDDFSARERGEILPRTQLLELLEREPGRFSPNVFLRPVVESTVFPALAYVGGPGEIAYFAQVSALFSEFGIIPPAFVPRFSGTVVEPHVEKAVSALRLGEEQLRERREVLIDRLAREAIPDGAVHALESLREQLATGFEALLESSDGIEQGLEGALGAVRNRIQLELHRSEKKIIRALKRSDLASLQQLERVLNALQPHGEPQDRVLNILPFLARYRGHLLREIERAIAISWRFPS